MIELSLPPRAEECVRFDASALIEVTQSWHVLVDPGHHSLQIPWVRACRSLPDELRRRLRDWGWIVHRFVPWVFEAGASRPARSFEDECAIVAGLPPRQIAASLAATLIAEQRFTGEEVVADERALAAAMQELHTRAPQDAERLNALLTDPPAIMATVLELLADYWRAAFQPEWERVRDIIEHGIAESGSQIAREGILEVMRGLLPEVRVDRATSAIRFEREHEHRVRIRSDEGLALTPSYYVWPHVRVTCDAPACPRIVYPIQSLRQPLPPDAIGDVFVALRALGGETRLALVRLLAIEPRSTQELAGLLMLSPAATSRHLHHLLSAGLVRTRRDGYYVLYEPVPQAFQQLAAALRSLSGA